MRVATSIKVALSATVLTLALGTAAQAAALRTFVSNAGNDANTASNCAVTAPCRTLAQAFTVTSNNGEIIVMDAGGFGAVTINRPVAIVGATGALIGVPAGGTGITVAAGASDIVIVKDLLFTGGGSANTTGIALTSGKLSIQNSIFRVLTTGLSVTNAKANVIDSEFIGNGTAVLASGEGIDTQNQGTAGPTQVRVTGGSVVDNTTAFNMVNPGVGKLSILLRMTQNSTFALATNIVGNPTMVTGSGTGCPCSSVGTYIAGPGFNTF